MRNIFLSMIIMIVCSAVTFSQTNQGGAAASKVSPEAKAADSGKQQKEDPTPTYAVSNEDLSVTMPSFSKTTDIHGKGDVLEVQFSVENNSDGKHQLYIFVLATREDIKWVTNSFNTKKIYPEKNDIVEFVPVPGTRDNFEYDTNGVKSIKRHAKDFKLGVDVFTGKPYELTALKNKINIRTEHLILYKKKYKFFNHVTILVYDDEGKVMYRQIYELKGIRTR
jgi:hypothetical protein